jgi:hypothetical protein
MWDQLVMKYCYSLMLTNREDQTDRNVDTLGRTLGARILATRRQTDARQMPQEMPPSKTGENKTGNSDEPIYKKDFGDSK